MGEGNEKLVYPSPWYYKGFLTCRKILRRGTSGFTSHPKASVLQTLIALKKSIALGRFRTRDIFGSNGKHAKHYTTKATARTISRKFMKQSKSSLKIKVCAAPSEFSEERVGWKCNLYSYETEVVTISRAKIQILIPDTSCN
jgi:hypothetical protein